MKRPCVGPENAVNDTINLGGHGLIHPNIKCTEDTGGIGKGQFLNIPVFYHLFRIVPVCEAVVQGREVCQKSNQ